MRIISFADGFTSATPPTVDGGTQENFVIANNQTTQTLFTIDSADFKSVFVSFELEREDVSSEYRQAGSFILSFDGTDWIYNLGTYQGDDFISSSLVNIQDVKFEISTASGIGSFKYSSGNMGASYSGNLKASITRIRTV